ncbi:MAG: (Na+)-NQR maturation NqrM [Gammaproteobacteria bacterium]
MIEVLASITIFGLVVAGMAIGVLRGRAAIQGSCGGLNAIPGIESDCGGTCRRPCPNKEAKRAAARAATTVSGVEIKRVSLGLGGDSK